MWYCNRNIFEQGTHTERKNSTNHYINFLWKIKLKKFYLSKGNIKWGKMVFTAWLKSWKCSIPSTCATYSFKLIIKRDNSKETGYKIWIGDLLKIHWLSWTWKSSQLNSTIYFLRLKLKVLWYQDLPNRVSKNSNSIHGHSHYYNLDKVGSITWAVKIDMLFKFHHILALQ